MNSPRAFHDDPIAALAVIRASGAGALALLAEIFSSPGRRAVSNSIVQEHIRGTTLQQGRPGRQVEHRFLTNRGTARG